MILDTFYSDLHELQAEEVVNMEIQQLEYVNLEIRQFVFNEHHQLFELNEYQLMCFFKTEHDQLLDYLERIKTSITQLI